VNPVAIGPVRDQEYANDNKADAKGYPSDSAKQNQDTSTNKGQDHVY
jgi:hypothetical protein